jgi:hypothetical protein
MTMAIVLSSDDHHYEQDGQHFKKITRITRKMTSIAHEISIITSNMTSTQWWASIHLNVTERYFHQPCI